MKAQRSTWLVVLGAAALIACAAVAIVLRRTRGSAVAVDIAAPARPSVNAENEPPELDLQAVGKSRALPVEPAIQPPTSSDSVESMHAANAAKARFRGRLVYETTRDPVPWCVVAVRAPNKVGELRITGADGRFATGFEYEAGALQVLASDLPSLPRDWTEASIVDHAPASAGEKEIALRMWPTCIFEGALPAGLDVKQLTCEVKGHFVVGSVRATKSGVLFWRVDWPLSTADNQSALNDVVALGAPWRLVLRDSRPSSDQGASLVGVAKFESFDGIVRAPMQWMEHGAIRLSFRTHSGRVPDWVVSLRLRGTDADTRARPLSDQSVSLLEEFTWPELAPGAYELSVDTQHCEPVEIPLTVLAGETTKLEVRLNCEAVAGAIRGTITSESGAYRDPRVNLDLHHADDHGSAAGNVEVSWTQSGGRWVGAFVFADLPSNDYCVCVRARPYAISPQEHIAARPGESVEFRVLDNAPRVSLGLRVFEKESGLELDEFSLTSNAESPVSHTRVARSNQIALESIPENGDFHWSISKRGYGCASGMLRDVRGTWVVDGSRRWIRVELARGTSLSISVAARDHERIAGATIVIDGADVGVTDERGVLRLVRDEHPHWIDVRYRDWRHSNWSRRATAETLDPCGGVSFMLEPPQ